MNDNVNVGSASYLLNDTVSGHIRIWQYNQETGEKTLLLEKQNLIVKQGANILASALAGQNNSAISHFYIGYSSDSGFDFNTLPAITTDDGISSFPTTSQNGYLRIPLAFPAAFLQETGYTNNVPYFTTFLTNGTSFTQTGQAFANGVKLYSLGLVNAKNPSGSNQDSLFSKVYFGPITYDSTHGLAITWGITFRAITP